MSDEEIVRLAYDGRCFVCEALADNLSNEFNLKAIPVQNLYKKYGLEHDAYLIVRDRKYKGYSWLIHFILRGKFKKVFTAIILASYPITVKYRLIKGYGGHPVKYLGEGKIFLKLATLFLSLYLLRWILKIWFRIWGLRLKHPI
ncbi:MAG TPA: hypothetical protein EYH44_04815 [Thermoprotei archaeon]|nr:hypothetical protein [Thermoprotei archaeon]